VRYDLTVLDAQHRPEVERRTQQTLSPPYTPALLQILQGTDGEEYIAASYRRLDRPLDLLEVSALIYDAQRLEQDEPRPHLRALRVHD
jgi:hypothetical protein